MTRDDALKRARELLSKRIDLPHNEEAAELVAGELVAAHRDGQRDTYRGVRKFWAELRSDNDHNARELSTWIGLLWRVLKVPT